MQPRTPRRRFSLAVLLIMAIVVMSGVLFWLTRVPLEPPTRTISITLPPSVFDGEDVEP